MLLVPFEAVASALEELGERSYPPRLISVWRAIMLHATPPITPICMTCHTAYGVCRCPHQGHFITQTLWVYEATKQPAPISGIRGWGVQLSELRAFKAVPPNHCRPEFRQLVKDTVGVLVERFSSLETAVVATNVGR